jgi:hypothetical protein
MTPTLSTLPRPPPMPSAAVDWVHGITHAAQVGPTASRRIPHGFDSMPHSRRLDSTRISSQCSRFSAHRLRTRRHDRPSRATFGSPIGSFQRAIAARRKVSFTFIRHRTETTRRRRRGAYGPCRRSVGWSLRRPGFHEEATRAPHRPDPRSHGADRANRPRRFARHPGGTPASHAVRESGNGQARLAHTRYVASSPQQQRILLERSRSLRTNYPSENVQRHPKSGCR